MKKALTVIIAGFVLCSGMLFGTKWIVEAVGKPDSFLVSKEHIYIGEKHRVYIYALKNFKLLKTFGHPGEGPGEFKLGHGVNSLTIDLVDNKLAVGSIGKLSLFTPEGKPIEERKVPFMQRFVPIENVFLSSTFLDSGKGFQVQGIALFDKEMKRKKILLKTDNPVGMGVKIFVPKPNYKYILYKNRIYLSADLDSLDIRVFDIQGNQRLTITHSGEKLKIPDAYIKKMKDYYRTSPDWKNFWEYLKQYLTFREYFPAVRDFFIDNDLIYIQTYKVAKQRAKWLVFGLRGNIKGTAVLPVTDFHTDHLPLHGILNGHYYYLKENLEEEIWEINRLEIRLDPLP
jgi:hypothetical protein